MKYILDDKSGLPCREVDRAEADKIIRDQADPLSARRRLRNGEWLTDRHGFSVRRKSLPRQGA